MINIVMNNNAIILVPTATDTDNDLIKWSPRLHCHLQQTYKQMLLGQALKHMAGLVSVSSISFVLLLYAHFLYKDFIMAWIKKLMKQQESNFYLAGMRNIADWYNWSWRYRSKQESKGTWTEIPTQMERRISLDHMYCIWWRKKIHQIEVFTQSSKKNNYISCV